MTREKITLTKSSVFDAARRFYEAGKLSAQGPTPMCAYVDPSGLPCAVGAAFMEMGVSESEIPEIGSVNSTAFNDVFEVSDIDLTDISLLQRAHDQWAIAARSVFGDDRQRSEYIADRETIFKKVLYGQA